MKRSRVFICYRREDSAGHAIALYDRLKPHIATFKDTDGIEPGRNFVTAIQEELRTTTVVLVLIGRRWLDELSKRQREDPDEDYVRLEIAAALQAPEIRTIPVLLGGAQAPRRSQLPDDIKELALRDAISLRDDGWADDVDDLIKQLRRITRPRRWFGRPVGLGIGWLFAPVRLGARLIGSRRAVAVSATVAVAVVAAGLWAWPRYGVAPAPPAAKPPGLLVSPVPKDGSGSASLTPSPSRGASASPAAAPLPNPVPTSAQVTNTGGIGLYLRESPSMSATRVQPALTEGTTLGLLGEQQVINGETWYLCEQPQQRVRGWASERFLRMNR